MHPMTTGPLAEERICDRIRRSDERRLVDAARAAHVLWRSPRHRWLERVRALFGRRPAEDELQAVDAYLCDQLSITR